MDLCNIREIKELLTGYGFNFSKSMGQNFLIEAWVPERIAMEAETDDWGVLEIGPGIGCLTAQLAKLANKVVAVELDKKLIPVLDETLKEFDNVTVIQGDIMKLDIKEVIKEHFLDMKVKVCSNLPYNITTPVLTALIESKCFDSITVMIQKEVAKRICAKAGTSDYGSFSVFANYYTEPEMLFDVSPNCFIPTPKVTSTVITLKMRKEPVCDIADEKHFFKVVRAAFGQRRKTLLNCLFGAFGQVLSKQELEEIIVASGFDARIRGEVLDIEGFAKISSAILNKSKKN